MTYAELKAKYPRLYAVDPYCWSGWPPGWDGLIDRLSGLLESYMAVTGAEIQVAQIKEKFATLRFYYDGGDDFVDLMVDMAEEASAKMCEDCGRDGKLHNMGWLHTFCQPCADAWKVARAWQDDIIDDGTCGDPGCEHCGEDEGE